MLARPAPVTPNICGSSASVSFTFERWTRCTYRKHDSIRQKSLKWNTHFDVSGVLLGGLGNDPSRGGANVASSYNQSWGGASTKGASPV